MLIAHTKRWLKEMLNERCCKVKNEDICSSFTASNCWSYNKYFDFTRACTVSSLIFSSYLKFYGASYILKNYNNLTNDNSSVSSIS